MKAGSISSTHHRPHGKVYMHICETPAAKKTERLCVTALGTRRMRVNGAAALVLLE